MDFKVGDVCELIYDSVPMQAFKWEKIPKGTWVEIREVGSVMLGYIPISGKYANKDNPFGTNRLFWTYRENFKKVTQNEGKENE